MMGASIGTSISPSSGFKLTMGAATSSVVKVTQVWRMALSLKSSTWSSIQTKMSCSPAKSLSGFMVIISLAVLMVATKGRMFPLALSSFRVILAPTLLSSNVCSIALSTILRTASSKEIVILMLSETPETPSSGENVTVGESASLAVKVTLAAATGLLLMSSTILALSAAYTNCSLAKLSWAMLIRLFAASQEASIPVVAIAPLASSVFRSNIASTLLSVRALPAIVWTLSLNVNVTTLSKSTPVTPSPGSKVTVGGWESRLIFLFAPRELAVPGLARTKGEASFLPASLTVPLLRTRDDVLS